MTASEIKAYEIFKTKFGEAEAAAVLQFMDEKIQSVLASQKEMFATKEDARKLEKEDLRVETSVKSDFVQLDKKIDRLDARLTSEISRLETTIEKGFKEQLKWLIVLLLGFASLIIAVVKLV